MAKRIMIVDDDADIRLAVKTVLSSAGYEVVEASTRQEAEWAMQSGPVHLAVLDVMMETDTEGFHLPYQIRRDEKFKDVPIIMFTCIEKKTGLAFDLKSSGDYLPVQAFLRKPLDTEELKREVVRLLS
jgi:CheY-like chemotaxis protein